jgi:hypothetical protein
VADNNPGAKLMAYQLQQVVMPGTGTGVVQAGLGGFPANYRYHLVSYWVCLGNGGQRAFVFANNVTWGEVSLNNSTLRTRFLPAVSQSAMLDAYYAITVGVNVTNIIVSVDSFGQRIQVYANDISLEPSSGASWIGAPSNFHLGGPSIQWNLGAAGSAAPGTPVGDFYSTAPAAFYDLSVTANRRKFIAADGTPVDLGANASSVTGTVPYTYLTVRPGGVANDFATNNGSGGPFPTGTRPLAFEPPGFCVYPVAYVPPKLAPLQIPVRQFIGVAA